jgi:hypothetical protein
MENNSGFILFVGQKLPECILAAENHIQTPIN